MTSIVLLLSGAAVITAIFALWFIRKHGEKGDHLHRDLAERIAVLQQQLTTQYTASHSLLHERSSAFERTARELAEHFGRLQEAQHQLARTSGEILDFQKMLRAPAARGGFGEVLLESLLADILPADKYALQYTLSTGDRADAVLRLADGHMVAVDAKFPLAAYEPLVRARDDGERLASERAFQVDVKARAKEVSSRYIVEADRTLPFAFMYVPSEGVFYEIVRRPELWNAVTQMRVFPVSPNSFLPYIYTIVVGLRGLRVQEEARLILSRLAGFQRDFARVAEEFGKVGTHLQQAQNRHADAQNVFERLRNRVDVLGSGASPELPAHESEMARADVKNAVRKG